MTGCSLPGTGSPLRQHSFLRVLALLMLQQNKTKIVRLAFKHKPNLPPLTAVLCYTGNHCCCRYVSVRVARDFFLRYINMHFQ